MKISAFSTFYLLCLASTTSVSAYTVRIVNRNGEDSLEFINNMPMVETSAPETHVPDASASRKAPDFSSEEILETTNKKPKQEISAPKINIPKGFSSSATLLGGKLHLSGFNPTEPLTHAEATFLEDTIRDAYNEFHLEHGIDRVANSVFVDKDVVGASDIAFGLKHAIANNDKTLKEENRSLLRGNRKLSWSDKEMFDFVLEKLLQSNLNRFQKIKNIQFLGWSY